MTKYKIMLYSDEHKVWLECEEYLEFEDEVAADAWAAARSEPGMTLVALDLSEYQARTGRIH